MLSEKSYPILCTHFNLCNTFSFAITVVPSSDNIYVREDILCPIVSFIFVCMYAQKDILFLSMRTHGYISAIFFHICTFLVEQFIFCLLAFIILHHEEASDYSFILYIHGNKLDTNVS